MPTLIDRRLNPKDKSLGNRQRFLKRARQELKRAVSDHVRTGKITDVDGDHSVAMPVRGTSEPTFETNQKSGSRDLVLPGNKAAQTATQLKTVGVHHYGLACDLVKDIGGSASWKVDFSFLGKLAKKFRDDELSVTISELLVATADSSDPLLDDWRGLPPLPSTCPTRRSPWPSSAR